jgi:hypothetical protein
MDAETKKGRKTVNILAMCLSGGSVSVLLHPASIHVCNGKPFRTELGLVLC